MSVWAVLAAAGRGERLGADRPKAFARAGRPAAARREPRAARGVGLDRRDRRRRPARTGRSRRSCSPRSSAAARSSPASRAARRAPSRCGSASRRCRTTPRPCLVHDAARPLASRRGDRARARAARRGLGRRRARAARRRTRSSASTATRSSRRSPRGELVAVQTPQAFVAAVLRAALAATSREATDCASLVEARGGRVKVVEGDPRLLKVTDAGRPRARRVLARSVIVDYHMHLRDPDARRSTHTVDGVERVRRDGAPRAASTRSASPSTSTTSARRASSGTLPYQPERCVYDLDAYVDAVLEAKRQGLPVKLGLEVDYVGGAAGRARRAARAVPVGLPARLGALRRRARGRRGAGLWATRVRSRRSGAATSRRSPSSARSGLVDVLAHPDLAKIFGLRPPTGDDRLARDARRRRRARDLDRGPAQAASASSIRTGAARAAASAACRSRSPPTRTCRENVGRDFDRALELARAAGYETVTVFEGRERAPGAARMRSSASASASTRTRSRRACRSSSAASRSTSRAASPATPTAT